MWETKMAQPQCGKRQQVSNKPGKWYKECAGGGGVRATVFPVVNAGLCSPGPSPQMKRFVALVLECTVNTKPPAVHPFRDCFSCRASHSKSCPLLPGQQATSSNWLMWLLRAQLSVKLYLALTHHFSSRVFYRFGDITTWLVFLLQCILFPSLTGLWVQGHP